MTDHPDIESDHDVHYIPVAQYAQQSVPTREAGEGHAHDEAKASGWACQWPHEQARGRAQGRAHDQDLSQAVQRDVLPVGNNVYHDYRRPYVYIGEM